MFHEHLGKLFQPATRVVRGCYHNLGVLHPSPHILIIFVCYSSKVWGEGEGREGMNRRMKGSNEGRGNGKKGGKEEERGRKE